MGHEALPLNCSASRFFCLNVNIPLSLLFVVRAVIGLKIVRGMLAIKGAHWR